MVRASKFLAVLAVFLIFTSSAYAFSLSDVIAPILSAFGISTTATTSSGLGGVTLTLVSPPTGPRSLFKVQVCGGYGLSSVTVDLYIDSMSNFVKEVTTDQFGCAVVSLTAPSIPGDHTLYARLADSPSAEPDAQLDFTVPGVAITSFSVSNPTVDAGSTFTVSYTAQAYGDVSITGERICVGSNCVDDGMSGNIVSDNVTLTAPAQPGTYTVSLEVDGSDGSKVTAARSITVASPLSVEVSVSPSSINVGQSVSISASGSASREVGGAKELDISVIGPDGSVVYSQSKSCSIGPSVSEFCNFETTYTPSSAGTYKVVATLVSGEGHRATDSTTFSASGTAPGLTLTVSPSAVTVGSSVSIVASAVGDQLGSVSVTVTDPSGSVVLNKSLDCGQSPTCRLDVSYTPSVTGTYHVTARADSAAGSATKTATFTAQSAVCTCTPHVSLSVDPTSVREGGSVKISVNGYASASGDCSTKPLVIGFYLYDNGKQINSSMLDCGAPYDSTCTNGPFTINYTPEGTGTHEIKAKMIWDNCEGATTVAYSDPVDVTVNPAPTPSISVKAEVNATEVYVGEPVKITATADSDNGVLSLGFKVNGQLYKSFSCDGAPVCRKSIVYTPESAGTYTVEAVAIDRSGAGASDTVSFTAEALPSCSAKVYVSLDKKIYTPDERPIAHVTGNLDCPDGANGDVTGLMVYVDGSAIGTHDCTGYQQSCSWDFVLPALSSGEHKVTADMRWLDMTAQQFRTASGEATYLVDTPPVASFTYSPTTVRAGQVVSFDASKSYDPDSGDAITSYAWSFGDGSAGMGVKTAHTFAKAGTYTVKLTVTDTHGVSSSVSKTITVLPPEYPPTITSLSVSPSTVKQGASFTVSVTARDPNGLADLAYARITVKSAEGKIVYSKNIGFVSGKATATVSTDGWPSGTYTVVAVAVDKEGLSSQAKSATLIVEHVNVPPVVTSFTATPSEVNAGEPVAFKICGTDSDGKVVAAKISFAGQIREVSTVGECATTTFVAPDVPGEYNAVGAVEDNAGAWSEPRAIVVTVQPKPVPPAVEIRISVPKDVNVGVPASFTVSASSDLPIVSVTVALVDPSGAEQTWSYTPLSPSFQRTISFTPEKLGTYTIRVTATNLLRATSTAEANVASVDQVPPAVTVSAPKDVNGPFAVSINAVDNYILRSVQLAVDGNVVDVWTPNAKSFEQNVELNLPTGVHTVSALAIDDANNSASARAEVNVVAPVVPPTPPVVEDNAPPSVQLAAEYNADANVIAVNATATDNNAVRELNIYVNGDILKSCTSDANVLSCSANYAPSSEGNYTILAVAQDFAGNLSEMNAVVYVSWSTGGEQNEQNVQHSYDLKLIPTSGTVGTVVIQGIVDGSVADLSCADVVVNVSPLAGTATMASVSRHDVVYDGHSACEVVVEGSGDYLVTAQWMGVVKSVTLRVFAVNTAAPESAVVAALIGLAALALLSRVL